MMDDKCMTVTAQVNRVFIYKATRNVPPDAHRLPGNPIINIGVVRDKKGWFFHCSPPLHPYSYAYSISSNVTAEMFIVEYE